MGNGPLPKPGSETFQKFPISLTPNTKYPTTCLLSGDDNSLEEDESENEPQTPITREMFYREILSEDPEISVKRKKKSGSRYRTIDNRDSLPFVVKDCSPDPYTKPDMIKKEAKKNTKLHKESNNNNKKQNNKIRKNLVGLEAGIASSIYRKKEDGTLDRVLGEFQLDKSTNCGDLLEIGDKEYQVLRAKCQYKYAGGKRFVMVRKILEVKDVTRLAEESFLKRQFGKTTDIASSFE